MAIVLCDGSPASLKAVDLSVVPNLVLQRLNDEQLVLLHASNVMQVIQAATTNAAAHATAGTAAPPAALDSVATLREQQSALHEVLQNTLQQLDKNKHVRDFLNYKVEMICSLNSTPAGAKQQADAAAVAAAAASAAAAGPAPGSSMGGRKQSVAAAMLTPATLPTALPAAPPPLTAELLAKRLAEYLHQRAAHHVCRHILLGVGNHVDGKSVLLGSVAKAVLHLQWPAVHSDQESGGGGDTPHVSLLDGAPQHDTSSKKDHKRGGDHVNLHCNWALWLTKPSGVSLRPGAAVKSLVVVDATDPESLQQPILDARRRHHPHNNHSAQPCYLLHRATPLDPLYFSCKHLVEPDRHDEVTVALVVPKAWEAVALETLQQLAAVLGNTTDNNNSSVDHTAHASLVPVSEGESSSSADEGGALLADAAAVGVGSDTVEEEEEGGSGVAFVKKIVAACVGRLRRAGQLQLPTQQQQQQGAAAPAPLASPPVTPREQQQDQASAGAPSATVDPSSPATSQPPKSLAALLAQKVVVVALDKPAVAGAPNTLRNAAPATIAKLIGKLKCDLIVVPPQSHGSLSEGVVQALVALPKPHLVFPPIGK